MPSLACICLEAPGPRRALRQADAVFVATASRVYGACERPISSCGYAQFAELAVQAAWKGVEADQPGVKVFLPNSEACGYTMVEGESYLVYAGFDPPKNWGSAFGDPTHSDEVLTVSLCSRTQPLRGAAVDLKRLGKPEWPAHDSWR